MSKIEEVLEGGLKRTLQMEKDCLLMQPKGLALLLSQF